MTSPNGRAAGHITLEGVVEARNDTGLKLDGNWLNRSKFRRPLLELPDAGALVRVEVDPRGYLVGVEVLDAVETPAALSTSRTQRDETISRLAVLKAASHFLGLMGQTREEVRSEHVLLLADKWLAWVRQQD